ncbi:hypothetical protein KQX54_017032 [Cotesia glomerata]|uniref:EB domain-containing protein n=1 Tax=Cotesia glomerata TaxID=32391 RepID=A0AAV7I3U6_COTGL|nr:hypothetical protein KQX54_017032 [Cotesia glomerata]
MSREACQKEDQVITAHHEEKTTYQQNLIVTSPTFCSLLIGEFRNNNRECGIRNSECVNYECQCKPQYLPYHNNADCQLSYLGMSCENSAYCKKRIKNTICINNTCECNANYFSWEDNSCRPLTDSYCENNRECSKLNSLCIDKICQCKPDDVLMKGRCLPIFLNKSCSLDADCIDIPHAKCWNTSMCVCETNFVQLESSVCVPLLEGYCTQHNDCIVKHSVCIKNKCQCDLAYTKKLSSKCEPISLGQPCESDINCKLIRKGICSQNKISVCESNTFALDEMTSLPTLNTYCMFDECQIESSHCHNNRCQCKPGYSEVSAY